MKTTNYILPLAAFAAGALFAKRNEGASVGKVYDTVEDVMNRIYRKPTGNERGVNDVIFFGVADEPYFYIDMARKAGVEYIVGANSLFGRTDKLNMRKLIEYLLVTDGYLSID